MLGRFKQNIEEKKLLPNGGCTLVAASAGVDSTVMCHLFKAAGLPFAIAHCNFQLRGEESNGDENFVKKLAQQLAVPFYSKKFETETFAAQNKIGIQEAARIQRYEWLNELLPEAACVAIATAHHLDDNIETVLFNFAKGTGIRGMRGILSKRDKLIRPLLYATKKELLDFAKKEQISFREDASNLTDKYSRNHIRHHVIPVLEEVAPNFQHNAGNSIKHMLDAEQLLQFAIEKIKAEVLITQNEVMTIDLERLLSYPAASTVLFELLRPFGFNATQVKNILQSTEYQSGSYFYTSSHEAICSSSILKLKRQENINGVNIYIDKSTSNIDLGSHDLLLSKCESPANINADNNTALLDISCIKWPLLLRHWQPGDYFQPIGMDGHSKKLQDFFTDKKLSKFEKEAVWILESGGDICWVVGMRLDERFKVMQRTKSILKLELRPKSE